MLRLKSMLGDGVFGGLEFCPHTESANDQGRRGYECSNLQSRWKGHEENSYGLTKWRTGTVRGNGMGKVKGGALVAAALDLSAGFLVR
jgi:hypothetical protein